MLLLHTEIAIRCIIVIVALSCCSSPSSSLPLRGSGSENNRQRILQLSTAAPIHSSNSSSSNADSGSTLVIVGAVGAVLSILLLIGGMCYAKRMYSSSSDADNPSKNSRGRRSLQNDAMEGDEKELDDIISSMAKKTKKKRTKKDSTGAHFPRGDSSSNNNNGCESDIPPPPPPEDSYMNDGDYDEQQQAATSYDDDDSDMNFLSSNNRLLLAAGVGMGGGNKSVAEHTVDDDMSFAFSVDQSSITPYNQRPLNTTTTTTVVDPYIGGAAALKSFQNEKGGVFEWNEDGTKMVYTPANIRGRGVGGNNNDAHQNGFVYDEVKKKWVVSKQVVGARGVSFKAMTSTNDGNSLEMLMSHDHKKKKINHISPGGGEGDGIRRTHSDVSITSDGTGGTGMSGLTGMESEFTFNAVGTDYSTARTRSETTFVSTGIAIPSLPTKSGAVGAAAAEGIEVSDLDRNIMLTDSEDLSIGSSTDGGHSDAGHIDGAIGYGGDERSEPGMIVPKKTVRRLLPQSNTIKEDSPFDEGGGIPFDERSRGGRSFTAGRISPKPVVGRFTSPKKPVPNFDNSSRQFIRRNRKPSFGRRV